MTVTSVRLMRVNTPLYLGTSELMGFSAQTALGSYSSYLVGTLAAHLLAKIPCGTYYVPARETMREARLRNINDQIPCIAFPSDQALGRYILNFTLSGVLIRESRP